MGKEMSNKKQPEENEVQGLQQELLTLLKEQREKDMQGILDEIALIKSSHEELQEASKDHIEAANQMIQEKLDAFDQALRGNGRVGVFEQIRGLRVRFRVLLLLVMLLIGGRVLGLTMEGWLKGLFGVDDPAKVEKVEKSNDTK